MKLDDIGFYTLSEDRCKSVSMYSGIRRAEIIITNVCNFACPYCRGTNIKGNMNIEEINTIITYLKCNNNTAIRFSVGEPTLHPNLIEFVKLSKSSGITYIAVSTNGSADLEYYMKLVDSGVNDFSISLDACCANTAKVMSGGIVILDKIIKNIESLSKISYVTVGIVFNEQNENEVIDTIRYADKLGVSDIRIIPSAQYNRNGIIKDITFDFINKYPILKYRINNFKNGIPIRGLKDTDSKKCAVVLDDLVIADGNHYPCVIYFREKGMPIGGMLNSSRIREERNDWYNTHNCLEDTICRNNCLDCLVLYNNKNKEYLSNV